MKKLLSIVSPVYNEEGNIENFYKAVTKVLSQFNKYDYEIVLVNDGSKDNSLIAMLALAEKDKRVKIVNFSKNFGHQMAITAGMDNSRGDAVIILDSDLQDPPSVITQLVEKWENGAQIVDAKRKSRNDGFFKDTTAKLFYKFLNSILTNKLPENVGDFRLLDRRCINVLKQIKEKDRYLRGLSSWIGFKHEEVLYDRDVRRWGETHYPISKMLALAQNAIFSFSSLPIKFASLLSFILLTVSLIIVIYAVVESLLGNTVPGWTSQVLIFSIFSGIQMSVMAIISEYVGRIYKQVQDRPLYIIADRVNFD